MESVVVALPDSCCSSPIESVADIVDRLRAIATSLPPDDGLAQFNRMYLTVSEAVLASVDRGFFGDVTFLSHLDVVFANRYLVAVRASSGMPTHTPHCWRALLQRRRSPHVAPMQFALAGMASHIAYDLVMSVIETLEVFGYEPDDVKADYLRVNSVLASVEHDVRCSLEHGEFMHELDAHAGKLLDDVGNWSLAASREAAFADAEFLWALRHHRGLLRVLERVLDATVAFANDCLLVPASELKLSHLMHVHAFWAGEPSGLPALDRLRHRPLPAAPRQRTPSESARAVPSDPAMTRPPV